MKRIFALLIFCCSIVLMPTYAMAKNTMTVKVQGVSGDIRTNVETRIAIDRKEIDGHLTPSSIRNFAFKEMKEVRAAITPYGYFKAKVDYWLGRDGQHYTIFYVINLGRPVRITKVDVRLYGPGANNHKLRKYVSRFPLKVGEIFNSAKYTSARDDLFDVANKEGYIKSTAEDSKVLVNTNTYSASIILHLNTRERYYFGDLYINKTPYADSFMTRFNVFNQNKHFSSEKLLTYQQDMNNSRYFKQVIVIPDVAAAKNRRVPIHASVVAINDHRYTFGLGYGTFTGPRFTAGVNYKRLTNTGHALDAKLKLSSVLSGVAAKYFIPGQNPLTEQWSIGLNFSQFKPKTGSSRSQTLTFGYNRKMKRWTLDANLNFMLERYKVNNTPPARTSQLLYPYLNLAYLKSDNIIKPRWARSLSIMLQGGSKNLLSTTSFLQGQVKGKIFMTPLSFMHLIARGSLGYTVVQDLNELPLSMRFFAGGMNSIRGFPDSSIGPGKYLGTASLEYRNHLYGNFSGAVFYDVGTATNHFGTPPLSRGAGVGLIYESIVGPIKLYVAKALSKRGQPYQIEFSMGPEF